LNCVGVKCGGVELAAMCERGMPRVRKREGGSGKERAKREKEWRGGDAKCVCVRKTGRGKRRKEKDRYRGNDGRWEKRA